MNYEQISLSVADGIATLTLNRPERLNAYTPQMRREIAHAFGCCDEDDAVRAVVVTGAGRAFCAGADLSAGTAMFDHRDDPAYLERLAAERAAAVRPWEMRKPVIAAINGVAVGVGATMTLQWDLRLAAESARIGFVFVRLGLPPEALSTWILPRLIGVSRAAELLLTGRMLSAREACDYGIVSRVVPDAELLPTAYSLAREIAAAAPVAVAVTKRLLWYQLTEFDLQRAEEIEQRLFSWAGQQDDVREGVRALREKRAAQWKGSASHDLPDFLPGRRHPGAGEEPRR